MIGTLNLAGTSHLWASGTAVEAEDVQTAVESQLAEPQDFAGTVAETEKGIVLKTADGIFFLEGLDITGLVNKEVVVTGVLRSDDQSSSIFVMKAEVKG